jgi:hypothetical protein
MAPGRGFPRGLNAFDMFVAEPTAESPIVVGKRKEVQGREGFKVSSFSRFKASKRSTTLKL